MQNKSTNYHIQCEIAYLLTSEHKKEGFFYEEKLKIVCF